MSKAMKQVALLRQDGYYDAAKLIEEQSGKINLEAEWLYLLAFVRETDFDNELAKDQLRALWTAYCFHADAIPDTLPYDEDVRELWNLIESKQGWWEDFDSFDDFLCGYLV